MKLHHAWPMALLLFGLAAARLLPGPGRLLGRMAALRGLVAVHPVLAPLCFTGLYVLVAALALPGAEVMTLAGGVLFGTVLGSLCTVGGATAGSVVLFLLARTALGGRLAGRAGGVLARIRPGLERDGFWCLLALRLLPVMPFPLISVGAGLVGMRVGVFALGTLLGITPATVVFSAAGTGIGAALAAGGHPGLGLVLRPGVLLPLLGRAALALVPVAWRRVRRGAA